MNLIDMHCDTICELLSEKTPGQDLKKNNLKIDIEKLKKGGSAAQFFACFVAMDEFLGKSRYEQAYEYVRRMAAYLKKQIWIYSDDIAFAGKGADLEENRKKGKLSAFLTLEEGGVMHGDLDRVKGLYDMGIRLITLTWNYENCIGYPNSRDLKDMGKGLKPFGFSVIDEMNRLGMIVDVSHLSEGGFWDVVSHSKTPPVASHSNARALRDHPRNLSDRQIRALAEKGGVAGLNFYQNFLGESGSCRIDEMVGHVRHMYRIGGEDFVAVGTDFDGFSGAKEMEISDIGEMPLLSEALKKSGFTWRQIEKIWYGNAKRMIDTVL